MIGLGSLCDRLYRLNTASFSQDSSISSSTSPCTSVPSKSCNLVSSNVAISFIPSNEIWHFRLGNLSNQRLSKMHQLYSYISVDICHFSNQIKLPYSLSNLIASSRFELLHLAFGVP